MLPNTRLTLLAIAAVLALQFPSARAGAQSPPTPVSTVDEEITIDQPFTFHKLAAEIVSIQASCAIWKHPGNSGDPNPTLASNRSASKPVSTAPKAADGSISGTFTTVLVFKRAVDLTGTLGGYVCHFWGNILAGPITPFLHTSSDPRFKTTAVAQMKGSFTW